MPRLALALAFALAACGTASSGNDDDGSGFENDLSFGTGVGSTGFDLVGEGTCFSAALNPTIWFRLESAANFEGRFVRLYFNKLEQRDFGGCANDDAHLCLSSFPALNPGTYEVEAYLVETVVDIGQETLVARRPLEIE